jgi:SulP family sulfate permease
MRLEAFPFVATARAYTAAQFRCDCFAGLTVAVFAIPQTMAYALLAGLPVVYGLYGAVVISILAALWGSSPYVNIGPTNDSALLTASCLSTAGCVAAAAGVTPHAVFLLTLLVGVVGLLLAACRAGRFLSLVPEPALIGFATGVAVLIMFGQLHYLLGVEKSAAALFPQRVFDVCCRVPLAHPVASAIGLGTLGIMMALGRYGRRYPIVLLAVALATATAWLAGDASGLKLVRDIRPVPNGLPLPVLPPFSLGLVRALLPSAFAIAAIALIEAVAIGQSLALRHGRRTNPDQECLGLGLAHLVGGFFQCMPGSGSYTRSALVEQTGGQTRFANVFFGIATGAALVLLPGLLNRIPLAALAGLLVYIGIRLVDLRRIRRVLATSRADSAVMLVTCGVTVAVGVEHGVFTGILLGALILLNRMRQLKLFELVPDSAGHFHELAYEPGGAAHAPSPVVAVSVAGDLYYAVSDVLRERLAEIVQTQRPAVLILRMRRAELIDYTCWSALLEFAEQYHRQGGRIYLCGVSPEHDRVIGQLGMRAVLPQAQVFLKDRPIFQALHAAVHAALDSLPAETPLAEGWRRLRVRQPE